MQPQAPTLANRPTQKPRHELYPDMTNKFVTSLAFVICLLIPSLARAQAEITLAPPAASLPHLR